MRLLPAQRAAVVAGFVRAMCYAFLAGFSVPAQRTFMWCRRRDRPCSAGDGRAFANAGAGAHVVVLLDRGPCWPRVSGCRSAPCRCCSTSPAIASAEPRWIASCSLGRGAMGGDRRLAALLLFFFQQFSLVSPLANALAIPAVRLRHHAAGAAGGNCAGARFAGSITGCSRS